MLKLSSRDEPYIVTNYTTKIINNRVIANIYLNERVLKLTITQGKNIEERKEIDQFLQVILRLASYPTYIVHLSHDNNKEEIIFGIKELLKYRILKGKLE
ncbi:MAG: hypothetical protein WCR63_04550 [Bacilli bacterium]